MDQSLECVKCSYGMIARWISGYEFHGCGLRVDFFQNSICSAAYSMRILLITICSSVTMTMQLVWMGTHQMVWGAITFTLMVECINKGFFGQSCVCKPGHLATNFLPTKRYLRAATMTMQCVHQKQHTSAVMHICLQGTHRGNVNLHSLNWCFVCLLKNKAQFGPYIEVWSWLRITEILHVNFEWVLDETWMVLEVFIDEFW